MRQEGGNSWSVLFGRKYYRRGRINCD